jgi:hypothetical protein
MSDADPWRRDAAIADRIRRAQAQLAEALRELPEMEVDAMRETVLLVLRFHLCEARDLFLARDSADGLLADLDQGEPSMLAHVDAVTHRLLTFLGREPRRWPL